MVTYTHYCAPIVMGISVATSITDYQSNAATVSLGIVIETPGMAIGFSQPLWRFDDPQMTFDDGRYTFDGLFALVPPPPPPPPPVPPPFRVCAITAGLYNGQYHEPGDVFDLADPLDFSDSTKNVQPSGAEYAPGWMKAVPVTTPIYQANSDQLYPTNPAVDPARRFVL